MDYCPEKSELSKTMLEKDTNELVRKVFQAEKNPSQGNFVKLVDCDIKDLGITHDEVTWNAKEDLKNKKLKINARNVSFL